MDSLYVAGIECWTHIGVPVEERKHEQCIHVSLELFTDTTAAAKSDDVEKSINYAKVTEHVLELAKVERKTIERFAEDIANELLKKFKPVSVKVSVTKRPLPTMQSVTLTIIRP